MVGFIGVAGNREHEIDSVDSRLCWTGRERASTYTADRFALRRVRHRADDTEPGRVGDDDALIWLHGRVFGVHSRDGYRPRSDDDPRRSSAEYCAGLVESKGTRILTRLNGEFSGVLFDADAGVTWLITDRVGSRPIYYTRPSDGELVFASTIQALPSYPGVDTAFDPDVLAEYFTHRRVTGAKTPLVGVQQLPPASILRFDDRAGSVSIQRYWKPSYEPATRSYASFVEEFTDLLLEVLDERLDAETEYGLLLSGGGDSRLVLAALAALEYPVTAFHMNEWNNREVAIAERSAKQAGVAFRFLRRDAEYQERQLQNNPGICEFVSRFDQCHLGGFRDEFADIDVLLSGKMIEEVLGRHGGLPTRTLQTGLGQLDLPLSRPMATLNDYLSAYDDESPSFLTHQNSIIETLTEESRMHPSGEVELRGITHSSLAGLGCFNELYPLTDDRDYMDYGAAVQLTTHWSPFLDNRMLSLAQEYPLAYRLRRNIAYDSLARIAPALAELPDANSRLPGTYPALSHQVAETYELFRAKFWPRPTPAAHFSHRSWTNHQDLIRTNDFVQEAIDTNSHLLDGFSFLSLDGARDCLRDHLNGASNVTPLYTLATFLEMPLTETVFAKR